MARRRTKPKQPPPLIPHPEYNEMNGAGVAIVRIPQGTPPTEKYKALQENRALAIKISRPWDYDRDERKY